MSDEDVTKIITVTSDESKSPQDLEAEIAHAASTLGGLKKERTKKTTTKTKKKPTTAKKESPKKPAITVAQRKTIVEEPVETTDEPEEHVISVRTVKKVVKPVSTPTEPVETKQDDETKIPVTVKKKEPVPLPAIETLATKPSVPPKPIIPPEPIMSDSSKIETKKTEELPPVSPKTEDEETTEDGSGEDETADKLSLLSTELAARATSKELQQEDEQQQAKVYDTNKYHLAIKPNRHHRNSALPLWAQITILVALIAGGALFALQTDLIDQIMSLL